MKALKKVKMTQLKNDELQKLQGGCSISTFDIKTYTPSGNQYIDRSQKWDSCSPEGGYV